MINFHNSQLNNLLIFFIFDLTRASTRYILFMRFYYDDIIVEEIVNKVYPCNKFIMCLLVLLMEWFISFRIGIECRIVLGIYRTVILLCFSISPFIEISFRIYSTILQIFLLLFFLFYSIVIRSYCIL